MTIDGCEHKWSKLAELCETGMGELLSPICVECGAVKLVEDQRRAARQHAEIAARPINLPPALAANTPPAGARVHTHQAEFFLP